MSYIPEFEPPAIAEFSRLEFWLQEKTLDVIEELLANPSLLKFGLFDATRIYDFAVNAAGLRHYVLLTIALNSRLMVLTVAELGHFAKPLP